MSDTAQAQQMKPRKVYLCSQADSNKGNKLNVLQILHAVFKTTVQWILHRKEAFLDSTAVQN